MSRNLLELTAISGEFPQKDLYRIAGGKSYKESVVGTLKREGLIKTYYRDSLRGLRLTRRAKRLLVQNSPCLRAKQTQTILRATCPAVNGCTE